MGDFNSMYVSFDYGIALINLGFVILMIQPTLYCVVKFEIVYVAPFRSVVLVVLISVMGCVVILRQAIYA